MDQVFHWRGITSLCSGQIKFFCNETIPSYGLITKKSYVGFLIWFLNSSLLNYYSMVKVFQRFKLSIIAGFMTLVMLIPTVFDSYGQYQDPPDGYSEDVVTRMEPSGDGGSSCYNVLLIHCANERLPGVYCFFTGVYGPPYDCWWRKCSGSHGTRHCVRK